MVRRAYWRALGLAATEEQPESAATVAFVPPEQVEEKAVPTPDPQLVAAAERRKARLRSLLDSM